MFYDEGVYPDWWKLEPMPGAAAWRRTCAAIEANDPHVQGIVVLGLDAPAEELKAGFDRAAAEPLVKGFAVGRTIFSATARDWLGGKIDDTAAVGQMAEKYEELCRAWDTSRSAAGATA